MTDESGWRQKLEALRERPKPAVLQPKKSHLVPYGTPPSPAPKTCPQLPRKCDRAAAAAAKNRSQPSSRSRSPEGATDCGGEAKRRATSRRAAGAGVDPREPPGHVKLLSVADPKDCSHLLAVLNVANQKETLRHVTAAGGYVLASPEAVPECLNTFSDFYNPSVSADERFEKYLAEMHRREREVEADERTKIQNYAVGGFHCGKYDRRRRPAGGQNARRAALRGGAARPPPDDDFRFRREGTAVGLQRAKKPLAISTFSLLDTDKLRHKDGALGVPHTTR